MYGTRDAAQNWGECCADVVAGLGFQQGKASACTSCHHARNSRTHIHGDDIGAVDLDKGAIWMPEGTGKKFELTIEIPRPSKDDRPLVKVLNRIFIWT